MLVFGLSKFNTGSLPLHAANPAGKYCIMQVAMCVRKVRK